MAKMTLAHVSSKGFTAEMQNLLGAKLPAKTAFRVKSLIVLFNGELAKYNDLRTEILERFCRKGEDGKTAFDDKGNYQFDADKMAEVSKEMNELGSIEVEFTPISINELGDTSLTAQQIFDLNEVICE